MRWATEVDRRRELSPSNRKHKVIIIMILKYELSFPNHYLLSLFFIEYIHTYIHMCVDQSN